MSPSGRDRYDEISIVRITGDGVGPELVDAGTRLLAAVGLTINWIDARAGMAVYAERGTTVPPETIEAIRSCKAVIKGPFTTPSGGTIRSANYYLRRDLDLYACLRPIPVDPAHPILLVRENVEDLYPALEWKPSADVAWAIKTATTEGSRRIVRYGFDLARRESRKKLTLVHKANNLKLTEGMFLDVARDIAREYPDVTFDEMLADTACSSMVLDPSYFDVIVTSNTFGDLLSSVGAAVAGSVGLVGSLNSGHGIYVAEAAHGDAVHLAGHDQVNPLAFLDSVRLLLEALGCARPARAIDSALQETRRSGPRTLDLGGAARTSEIVAYVCDTAASRLDGHDG